MKKYKHSLLGYLSTKHSLAGTAVLSFLLISAPFCFSQTNGQKSPYVQGNSALGIKPSDTLWSNLYKGLYVEATAGGAFTILPIPPGGYNQLIYANNGAHYEFLSDYMFSSHFGVLLLVSENLNSYNIQEAYNNYGLVIPQPSKPYQFIECFAGINPTIRISRQINIQFIAVAGFFRFISPIIYWQNPNFNRFVFDCFGCSIGINSLYKLNNKTSIVLKVSYTNAFLPNQYIFPNVSYAPPSSILGFIEPSVGIVYRLSKI